jgi:hypothetical protein
LLIGLLIDEISTSMRAKRQERFATVLIADGTIKHGVFK